MGTIFVLRPELGAVALLWAVNAHAIPTTAGHTSLSSTDDLYTFTFDSLGSDIASGDGLYFTDNSISWSLYAEAFNGSGIATIRQDASAHGGLGVDGGTYGNNWERGEYLKLSLSNGQLFDIVGLSFNGGNAGELGDCVLSNSIYDVNTSAGDFGGTSMKRADGCLSNGETVPWYSSSLLEDISWVELRDWQDHHVSQDHLDDWIGYLESVTIRTSNVVPEPSIIGLFTAGLVGIGFTRRRRKLKA